MNEEYINNPGDQLVILLSPLDWGLGHATRCIPLIQILQKYRAIVLVAAENPVATLLQQEFPGIRILPLPGYHIRYGKAKKSFLLKIISQLPKISAAAKKEQQWLQKLIAVEKINGIISDNRLGLHAETTPCVYITHQLHIETGHHWLNKIAQRLHYRYINRFGNCWVPDFESDSPNLSGRLGHPALMPATKVTWLGPLSRFRPRETTPGVDLLILLSGPEPQRTIFEQMLLQQLKDNRRSVVFVRGLPGDTSVPGALNSVRYYNHLPAEELGDLLQQSALVLARSGYSTIMDLAALQKKAILVPTPGQGEQEYLASYLHGRGIFYSATQENFDLETAISQALSFPFKKETNGNPVFEKVVFNWLTEIRKQLASP